MPKPIDATLKDLLETNPVDWPRLLRLPVRGSVRLENVDLSTVTAMADKVLWVEGINPYILHLEFQAHWDRYLADRLHLYNTLLYDRYHVPVHTAVVLLRRGANVGGLSGRLFRHGDDGNLYLEFRYEVLPVWEMPTALLLESGPAIVPLAPLSDEAPTGLPEVVRRMQQQLAPLPAEKRAKLWTATYILMGLRYPAELTDQVLQGVLAMEESVTYQAIINKGKAMGVAMGVLQEAKALLLRLGSKRFGAPDEAIRQAIEAIGDLDQLERLSERLLDVSSWQELLAAP